MIPQLSFYNYRPVYNDIPIEDYQNAFAQSAKAYETNLENYNLLQAFASSIKALPQDQQYVKDKIMSADAKIKHISDQVQGNQRYDLAGTVLQKMKADYNADPKLNAIRESYINFAEGEKQKAEMRAKGITPFELTDINSHRSFDDEGNVNIYRPNIQAKADYVEKAQEIIAQIAPDIVELNLQPSEIEGILQGKTIKGLSKDKLLAKLDDIHNTYNQTAEGQQHKLFVQKNSPEVNPDKFIRDFLFGVGNLRTFSESRTNYTPDPSYQYAQRAELLDRKLQNDLIKQRMKGSKSYDTDPNIQGLLRRESLRAIDSGVKDEKTGLNKLIKSNALMISNAEIIKDLSYSFNIGDGSRIVPLDKRKKFNFEEDSIESVKIKGFALDEENGTGTLGGSIAELTYIDSNDDKKKTMNVVIQPSDESFKNIFTTHQSVSNILKRHNKGNDAQGKGHSVADTSGLLGDSNAFAFYIDKNNEVRPQVKKTDGTWRLLNQAEREALSLKEKYSMADIEELTSNKVAQTLKPYVKTSKEIQASE